MTNVVTGLRRLLELYWLLFIVVCLTLAFFQIAFEKAFNIPSFTDEILLITFLGLIATRAINDVDARKILTIFSVSFCVMFLLSIQAISHRGLGPVLIQILIHLKVIIYFGFAWLFLGPKLSRKILVTLLFITCIGMLINLATGTYFNQIFNAPILLRGGMIRPIGLQADTASLGTTLGLLGVLFVTILKPTERKQKVFLLVLFTTLLLLSTSRTSLLVVPIIVLWWFKQSFKTFVSIGVVIGLLFTILPTNKYVSDLIEITQQNIEWTTNNPVESAYIRGIMIYFGIQTANENFPVGRGAATYGTVFSTDSIVYTELGLRSSRFFVEAEGIYDSNLASLLGELGYMGTLFYLFVLFKTFRIFHSDKYMQPPEFIFSFAIAILVYALSTPIFMNSYPAFLTALIAVGAYREKSEIETDTSLSEASSTLKVNG